VPNPSFENANPCPNNFSQLGNAAPWSQAGTGTPDLYASCSTNTDLGIPINLYGSQIAHTGTKYSGLQCMCAEYREYIEVPLTNSLSPGVKYFVSFFVSLADTFAFTSSSLGAYLSTASLSVNHYSTIPVNAQIQNNTNNYFTKSAWTKVTGSFFALGGEAYMTIGNFNSPASTTSMAVESNTMVYNPNCIYFYIDDVCISTDSSFTQNWTGLKEKSHYTKFKVMPNPAVDYVSIYNPEKLEINAVRLINSFGQIVYTKSNIAGDNIFLNNIPDGLYFIEIISDDKTYFEKIIVLH